MSNEYEERNFSCSKNHGCGHHNTITPPHHNHYYSNCNHHHEHTFCQYHNCCHGQCGCHFHSGCESDPIIIDTNKHDNTKENLLVVDGAKELLTVTSGVPSTQKTILTVKRDNTKTDKTEHDEDFKKLTQKITALENKVEDSNSKNLFLTNDTKNKLNRI